MPIKKSKVLPAGRQDKSQKSKVQNKETTPLGKAASSAYTLYPIPSGGYTLIELLIVIAIIAILSMTSFVYFNNFGVSQGVDRNVLIIQNAIEIAQTNASTGLKCPVANSSLIGWMLEFNGANINLKCESKDLLTGDISDVTVKTYTLDTKASIDPINPSAASCSTSVSYPRTPIAIFFGSSGSKNKFIFNRDPNTTDTQNPTEACYTPTGINIKINYNEGAASKTFGLNLSGAIN